MNVAGTIAHFAQNIAWLQKSIFQKKITLPEQCSSNFVIAESYQPCLWHERRRFHFLNYSSFRHSSLLSWIN